MKDPDAQVRQAVVDALSMLQHPRITAALAQLITDDNIDVRRAVVRTLAVQRDPAVVDALIRALQDADQQVRLIAISSLGRLKDPKATEPLIACLVSPNGNEEENYRIQKAIVLALHAINDAHTVDALSARMKGVELNVAATLINTLGQLRDPRAVDVLLPLLAPEANKALKHHVISALSQTRSPQAATALVNVLYGPDKDRNIGLIYTCPRWDLRVPLLCFPSQTIRIR